eukprot:365319-Chlamydomonas_euryale.AAC.11
MSQSKHPIALGCARGPSLTRWADVQAKHPIGGARSRSCKNVRPAPPVGRSQTPGFPCLPTRPWHPDHHDCQLNYQLMINWNINSSLQFKAQRIPPSWHAAEPWKAWLLD